MTTKEIANRLVELCRMGQNAQAYKELFSADAVAIEPESVPERETKGVDALLGKMEYFKGMIETYHGGTISEPLVAGNFFSLEMSMDVTYKGQARRTEGEICVYEVKDGKIVKEQFFF
jgi:hypothetical protein